MAQNLFYFLSFLAILSALMVVFSKNPVYSVLYLIITFFSIAGHYILLNAEFLFIVHIIVYAGAIMVLFLYVIMMLNLNRDSETEKSNLIKIAATMSSGLLLVVLIGSLKASDQVFTAATTVEPIGQVRTLGRMLFNEFLLPFEITSILLLAAIVGSVMLAKSNTNKV
jgi:NADH-quinone oxidoreductase subunit J